MEKSLPSIEILAKISIDKFNALPKKGKPHENEWTVLSTIIQHDFKLNVTKVVAIGTGTKCIGQSQLCPNGLILNDSHAEVIARRSFLRYIYEDMENAKSQQNKNIFLYNVSTNRFKLKDSISFHFFSTHAPCGDASIIEKYCKSDYPASCKKLKLDVNTVYTGAKLIDSTSTSDRMNQIICGLRTKPGRGERTLSMSCSDKLSRWNLIGIQGALLDTLLENPIYLQSLNFCGEVNEYSIHRAITGRWKKDFFSDLRFQLGRPKIRIIKNINFLFSQSEGKVPSPASIAWCDIEETKRPLEVAVSGKKQGVIKKNLKTKLGSLEICKFKLYEKYVKLKFNSNTQNSILNYLACKQNSVDYQRAWQSVKRDYFKNWIVKSDELLEFHIAKSTL